MTTFKQWMHHVRNVCNGEATNFPLPPGDDWDNWGEFYEDGYTPKEAVIEMMSDCE